ncbi:MAG: BlaI/MecI/CopY family transcriptional regulator [Chitinophagaceae bacterium]
MFVRNISYLYFMNNEKSNSGQFIEPTKAELEILQVLWQNGPSTVRLVNEKLNQQKREVNYTSTLKLMQIMVEKGILKRDQSNMKHVYEPIVEEKKAKGYLLDRFLESMYQGSASNLVLQLLGNKKTSKKELETIKEMLNNLNKNN